MLAGLDVGGTHTDAVLMDGGRCVAWAKAPTRQDDLLPGMLEALAALFSGGHDSACVRRLTVSTTLGLNALLTGATEPVGMLAVPGPGLDPTLFWHGGDPFFRLLAGAQDHRGRVIARPDLAGAEAELRRLKESGARAVGIVVKFSPKNPELEQELGRLAARVFGPITPVVLGSSVSGSLNFPRRLHTVWCNAALAATAGRFSTALASSARRLGLVCPLCVLKADAGSFSLEKAATDPAATMGSGPAASLLGVWALCGVRDDALMIDMGGTSTDLALLADGEPLLSRSGLCAAGRPTLIRTLWTASLAVGGDSSLRCARDTVTVGPDRSGPALALCGPATGGTRRPPTLTDALNTLGLCTVGDPALSAAALERLAHEPECPVAVRGSAGGLARLFVDKALALVRDGAEALLADVNSRPVYTIRELMVAKTVRPARAVFIGGPAGALAEEAGRLLGLPAHAPAESAYANAIGAALARPTLSAELYADTLLGRMTIPDLGVDRSIERRYDLEDAKADMLDAFMRHDGEHEAEGPVQIVFAERFAVLDAGAGRGRILRVRAQHAAGLTAAAEQAKGISHD